MKKVKIVASEVYHVKQNYFECFKQCTLHCHHKPFCLHSPSILWVSNDMIWRIEKCYLEIWIPISHSLPFLFIALILICSIIFRSLLRRAFLNFAAKHVNLGHNCLAQLFTQGLILCVQNQEQCL